MDYLLIAYGILNMLFVLLISPLFISLIKIVKAHAQKSRGPPLLQTYRNLSNCSRKKLFTQQIPLGLCELRPSLTLQRFSWQASLFPCLLFPSHRLDRKHHSFPLLAGDGKVFHGALRARCRQHVWRHGQQPGNGNIRAD